MTAQSGHLDDRQVIPRWRSFTDTIQVGELRPLSVKDAKLDDGEVERAVARAQSHPSTFATAELLSTLMARGEMAQARSLAATIGDGAPLTLRRAAGRLVRRGGEAATESEQGKNFDASTFAQSLGSGARHRLRVRPNNPAAWVDLALAHTVQGQNDRAQREVRYALQLAPDSRFVLRAAARLFVHVDDPEQANYVLNNSARVLEDPWLLAAEISTAELAFGKANNIRRARALIELSDFSPHAVSELTSEVATSEVRAGRDQKARVLFRQSFTDPTENAVAQAVSWADRSNLDLDPALLTLDRVFEARALESVRVGDWTTAVSEAAAWHRDQPFSVEPIQFGSYAASVGAGQFERASEIAISGLRLHRDDRTLRNNAAYALANLGRTREARTYLQRPQQRETVEDLTEYATWGLIHFREGDAPSGKAMYQTAIAGFGRLRRDDLVAIATVHEVIEESLLGLSPPPRLLARVRRVLPLIPPAERDALAARVVATIRKSAELSG